MALKKKSDRGLNMGLRFVDSPDRYVDGNAETNGMLGVWAAAPTGGSAGGAQVVTPAFGARTGTKAFLIDTNGSTGDLRTALKGAAMSEVFFALGHYCDNLPSAANLQQFRLHDGSNLLVCYFNVQPTGKIAFRNSAGAVLGETTDPVVFAGQWKFFEFRVLTGAGSGVAQIRDSSGVTLLSISGLTIPGTVSIFCPRGQDSGVALGGRSFYLNDLSVKGTDGAQNNTWYPNGGVGNYLLRPVSDAPGNQWTFVARRTFNDGVGQMLAGLGNEGFSVPDAATLEIGSGDFTVEGNFRWNTIPTAGAIQNLVSKWDNGTQRSWRLYLYESGGITRLAFARSTDGTNGTVVLVHDFPFAPVRWQKYTISVSRSGGNSRMFINGVRVGPVVADAATYFNSTAVQAIGARQDSGSSLTENFIGWLDEVRLTVGVGRYTAEYTPSAVAYPRSIGGDPSFASVQLLVGWDTGLTIDQSSAGRTITSRGSATAIITDDGFFGYQSIDKPGRDDTFVEAAYLSATGTFELTANALNGSQVVVGAKTYTFNTVLGGANSILIGVDRDATVENLIAAVNLGPGIGTVYGLGTTVNADIAAEPLPGAIVRMTAIVPGTAGNSLVFTTTVVGAVISGAGTLTGGVNIPAASDYVLDRLPRGITRVDSMSIFTRRSAFGPGGAEMQPGFVDSALAVSNGVNAAAPSNPGWQTDLFDNNGGSPWTTTAFLGAKVRVNRTL
jgi:hypothetical protein